MGNKQGQLNSDPLTRTASRSISLSISDFANQAARSSSASLSLNSYNTLSWKKVRMGMGDMDAQNEDDMTLREQCQPFDFSGDVEQLAKQRTKGTREWVAREFEKWLAAKYDEAHALGLSPSSSSSSLALSSDNGDDHKGKIRSRGPVPSISEDPAPSLATTTTDEANGDESSMNEESTNQNTPPEPSLLQDRADDSDVSGNLEESKSRAAAASVSTQILSMFPLIFCIAGEAGTGKTTVTGMLCDRYAENVLAMHFCRRDLACSLDPMRIVLSLCFQLSEKLPDYRAYLLKALKVLATSRARREMTERELCEQLLIRPLRKIPRPARFSQQRAVIVIDGVDEVDGVEKAGVGSTISLLKILRDGIGALPLWIGVVLTSRMTAPFSHALKNYFRVEIRLDGLSAVKTADVKGYLGLTLPPILRLDSNTLPEKPLNLLVQKCNGLFLYVRMALAPYTQARGPDEKPRTISVSDIEKLPNNLNDLFRDILKNAFDDIGKKKSIVLKNLLEVMTAAREPLLLDALAEILQQPEATVTALIFAIPSFFTLHEDDVGDNNKLVSRVSLSHKSVYDWLLSVRDADAVNENFISLAHGHDILARACIRILSDQHSPSGLASPPPAKGKSRLEEKKHERRASTVPAPDWLFRVDEVLKVYEEESEESFIGYAIRFCSYHAVLSGDVSMAMQVLTSLQYVELRCVVNEARHVVREYVSFALYFQDPIYRAILRQYYKWCHSQLARYLYNPVLIYQAALMTPNNHPVCREALRVEQAWLRRMPTGCWVQWINKPQMVDTSLPVSICKTTQGPLMVLATNKDGSRLLTVGENSTILRDTETGDLVSRVHAGSKAACMSPDGQWVVVSRGSEIFLFSDETGLVLRGHTKEVLSIAFSPDSKTIVSGGEDNSVRLWSVEAGQSSLVLNKHEQKVTGVCFSRSGALIASTSADRTLRLWNSSTGDVKLVIYSDSWSTLYQPAFSPNGDMIFCRDEHGKLSYWETSTGLLKGKVGSQFQTFCLSNDGLRILGSIFDNVRQSMIVYDGITGAAIAELKTVSDEKINSWCWLPDGRVVGGAQTGSIIIWDIDLEFANGPTANPSKPPEAIDPSKRNVHTQSIAFAQFSPDGRGLLTSSHDGTISVRDAVTGKVRMTLLNEGTSSPCSWVSPDGRFILSCRKGVRLWDAATRECVEVVDDAPRSQAVGYSHDGRLIAAGGEDRRIRVWNIVPETREARLIGTLATDTPVTALGFSQNSRFLACPTYSSTILGVWNTEDLLPICTSEGHVGTITAISWSSDGKQIASAGGEDDQAVRVWHFNEADATLETERVFEHESAVQCVTWNASSTFIICGCQSGAVAVWEVVTGVQKYVLYHPHEINTVAITADGRSLAVAGGGDNQKHEFFVYIWNSASAFNRPVVVGCNLTVNKIPSQHAERAMVFHAEAAPSNEGCFVFLLHDDLPS